MLNNVSENGETQNGQSRAKAVDLAWLAGLLDGEGTVTLTMSSKRFVSVKTDVQITMANKEAIEKVRDIFYALTHRKYEIKERCYKHTRYVMYNVRVVAQKDCRKICEALLPYLVAKREQAEIVIEFCHVRKQAHEARGISTPYGKREADLVERAKVAKVRSYSTLQPGVSTERDAPTIQ